MDFMTSQTVTREERRLVALNPVAYTENVVQSFLRYQLTAYPFAAPHLHRQMRTLLSLDKTRQSPLLRGPFVSLSRPFRQGAEIADLVREGLLHPHLSERIPEGIRRLYAHQDRAIRSVAGGRTTLVSTGTGSREDRVLPLSGRQPLLRAPGPGGSAGDQRRHRLSHERAGGGPVDASPRAARGDGRSVRSLRRQDARTGGRCGGRPAARRGVAGGL